MAQVPVTPAFRRLACERCFHRKYKCDKVLPTCSVCISHGAECRSRPGHFSRPDGNASIKQSTIFQYIDSLKGKILDLEQADSSSPSKRQRIGGTHRTDQAPNRQPEELRATVSPVDPSPARKVSSDRCQSLSVREAMGEIAFLSRSAMAESRGESETLPRNLSLYNMLMAALNLDGSDPSTASTPGSHRLTSKAALNLGIEPVKLDRESTAGYMKLFTDHICFRFPHLSAQSAMKQYDSIVGKDPNLASAKSNQSSESCTDYFNTCLGVAIGALLSADAPLLSSYISALYETSKNELKWVIKKQDTHCIIKCMLLLAIFSLYSPSGGSTWHLAGLTMQKCIYIGLEKETESEIQGPKCLERRRLFWSAYILDREICMTMGRPLSLRDEDIHVGTRVEDNDRPASAEAAFQQHIIDHARLSSELGSLHDASQVLSVYHDICFWSETPIPLKRLGQRPEQSTSFLDQLKCKMMMRLIKPMTVDERAAIPTAAFADEVRSGIITACKLFIQRRAALSDDCSLRNSFLDDTDIFCAGVVCAYLSTRDQGSQDNADRNGAFDILQECSLVLSMSGGQFSSTVAFRKVILSISKRLRSSLSIHSSESNNANIPSEIKRMIPSYILKLVEAFLQ